MTRMRWIYGALLSLAVALGLLLPLGPGPAWGLFSCIEGDVNGDGQLDITDPVYLLRHLFLGTEPPVACASEPAPCSLAIVVRHAEKLDGVDDPGLSPEGQTRARRLAEVIAPAKVDLLIASDLRRTQETLQPIADAKGLEIEQIDDADPSAVAARLRGLAPGTVAVVAHHSYTIPTILKDLGVEGFERIDVTGKNYDNFLILMLPRDAKTQLLHLKY